MNIKSFSDHVVHGLIHYLLSILRCVMTYVHALFNSYKE